MKVSKISAALFLLVAFIAVLTSALHYGGKYFFADSSGTVQVTAIVPMPGTTTATTTSGGGSSVGGGSSYTTTSSSGTTSSGSTTTNTGGITTSSTNNTTNTNGTGISTGITPIPSNDGIPTASGTTTTVTPTGSWYIMPSNETYKPMWSIPGSYIPKKHTAKDERWAILEPLPVAVPVIDKPSTIPLQRTITEKPILQQTPTNILPYAPPKPAIVPEPVFQYTLVFPVSPMQNVPNSPPETSRSSAPAENSSASGDSPANSQITTGGAPPSQNTQSSSSASSPSPASAPSTQKEVPLTVSHSARVEFTVPTDVLGAGVESVTLKLDGTEYVFSYNKEKKVYEATVNAPIDKGTYHTDFVVTYRGGKTEKFTKLLDVTDRPAASEPAVGLTQYLAIAILAIFILAVIYFFRDRLFS